MTRGQLLKLLLSSSIAEAIDVEKLLWIPGQMVSIPSTYLASVLTTRDIIVLELERMMCRAKAQMLFDRDELFYAQLQSARIIHSCPTKIPLIIKLDESN